MTSHHTLRKGLLKVFVFTLLSLFLIPAATYLFVVYAERQQDGEFLQAVESRIAANRKISSADKEEARAFYREHPPSTICGSADPAVREYRDGVCAPYGELWQFYLADRIAFWTMVGGVALLATVLALGMLAFVSRGMQYASFVAGWRLLTLASAAEVVVQGAMCVWLSYWVSVYFTHKYWPKLIVIAGLMAGGAVVMVLVQIFSRVPDDNAVEAEPVGEGDAPRLWQRVRHLAARLKTAPPDSILAGIDANFFVTEAPLTIRGRKLTGRTLYISIPLLRVLDHTEADAVLGHELAHLRGGDTRSGALLGPKLAQYDHYCAAMHEGGLTMVVFFPLRLYQIIFDIALARDSREREFKADRIAARLVSPEAIAHSLVKIAAYSSYRAEIERKLFDHDKLHTGPLGIAGFVSDGLLPYARSHSFLEEMESASVPHPFDSHPPMQERMKNVGYALAESDYGRVVTRVPTATWVTEILTAADIEQRLWQAYEQQFAQDHEQSLAYRYEPANDEERAVVLKYFPPLVFQLKNGETVEVNYEGIARSGEAPIPWDHVKAVQYNDSSLGDTLVVTRFEKKAIGIGHQTTKIKLGGIKKQKDDFQAAVNRYWQRHQAMRAQQD
jgi:Zn-dependent protease with chaperone function